MSAEVRENLGTRRIVKLPPVRFPDADAIVRDARHRPQPQQQG